MLIRVFIVLMMLTFPVNAAQVMPRGHVTVESNTISLADVFTPIESAQNVPLAIAPAPGQKVVYDVNVLLRLARQYKLEWQPTSLEDRVTLTRASTNISNEDILSFLQKPLAEVAKEPRVLIELDKRNLAVDLPVLPAGETPKLNLTDLSYDAKEKRFSAELVITTSDPAPRIIPVSGRAMPIKKAASLNRNVETGEMITEADITWEDMPEDKISADSITREAQLVGFEARRPLQAGLQLRERDLRAARLVKRGQLVTMVIDSPIMKISAQGRALADAAMGETVKVVNSTSNRTIAATVTGDAMVSVPLVR